MDEKTVIVGRSRASSIAYLLGTLTPACLAFETYKEELREDYTPRTKNLPPKVFDKRKKRKQLARRMRRTR
jgi:hypothetical protein